MEHLESNNIIFLQIAQVNHDTQDNIRRNNVSK